MHYFDVTSRWSPQDGAKMRSGGGAESSFDAPAVFGGEAGHWTPEDLFVAAVDTCLLLTLMFYTEKAGIEMTGYESASRGTLEKTAQGMRFTFVSCKATATVTGDEAAAQVRELGEKVEKRCLVSASLTCPVSYELDVVTA